MPKYSPIPAVEEAFARWVREEDEPAELYSERLRFDPLRGALEELDPDLRVHRTVHATVERSELVLAAKATKLSPGLQYAQLDVYLSKLGRLGLLSWEWRREPTEAEPTRSATPPPEGGERLERAGREVRALLEREGVLLVPLAEAERVVRVTDDPLYDGEYYEIKVFEVLFGMGYPERQR